MLALISVMTFFRFPWLLAPEISQEMTVEPVPFS
jgi:hypothetical protein